jgi:hypothetical protein
MKYEKSCVECLSQKVTRHYGLMDPDLFLEITVDN